MTIPLARESLQEFGELCGMLRLILVGEPSEELLARFAAIEVHEPEDEIEHGLAILCREIQDNTHRLAQYREDRSVEFARLFLGPQHPVAVPYASYYLSEARQLMTEITIQVRGYYLEAGMAVTGLHRVPDDHIALELEFMAFLAEEGTKSLENGEAGDALLSVKRMEDFYHEHLTKWTPLFAERMYKGAESDFYRGAALALKGVAAFYVNH